MVTSANDWGFKISIDKNKCMITGHKRKGPTKDLQVYGKDLERVKQFKLIKKLDIIWSKTLRVHRIFLHHSNIVLLIEMCEMPLKMRKYRLVLKYLIKRKGQNVIVLVKTGLALGILGISKESQNQL